MHALPRAYAIGAETMQVFVANPRGWAPPAVDAAADEEFRAACVTRKLPVFVHAPYLINFGSPSADTLKKSGSALEFSLRRGAAIGARGVVMHAGSAVLGNDWSSAMKQLRKHVLRVLDSVAGDSTPRLLIEPTAGGGGALASDAESLHHYLEMLDRDPRVGVCLDTCHMHAAGHDLAEDFTGTLKAYGKASGTGAIELVHVNDSRDPSGSKRDRHEAIGRGTIGEAAFAALFRATATRRVPLVVETADADHENDIATLKRLRAAATH